VSPSDTRQLRLRFARCASGGFPSCAAFAANLAAICDAYRQASPPCRVGESLNVVAFALGNYGQINEANSVFLGARVGGCPPVWAQQLTELPAIVVEGATLEAPKAVKTEPIGRARAGRHDRG
jgi:hypothetical protein